MHIHWKHKNIFLIISGIAVAVAISSLPYFDVFVLEVGKLGFLGAILAGMFFASIFTVGTGALIIINLARVLPVFPLIIFAATGAVLSDMVIFKLVKNDMACDVSSIYAGLEKFGRKTHLRKIIHTKYFLWTLPVIGALFILLPLPDELGVTLLGISSVKSVKFMIISFCCHSLGMFLLISVAALV